MRGYRLMGALRSVDLDAYVRASCFRTSLPPRALGCSRPCRVPSSRSGPTVQAPNAGFKPGSCSGKRLSLRTIHTVCSYGTMTSYSRHGRARHCRPACRLTLAATWAKKSRWKGGERPGTASAAVRHPPGAMFGSPSAPCAVPATHWAGRARCLASTVGGHRTGTVGTTVVLTWRGDRKGRGLPLRGGARRTAPMSTRTPGHARGPRVWDLNFGFVRLASCTWWCEDGGALNSSMRPLWRVLHCR
ncbi:hypothetical protein C8Q80DRAFT_798456 [Daedaleopsis nitida]|nr:hypothetical protein C8Q80DRAFT_798456 [Daedaleopsis nitida]